MNILKRLGQSPIKFNNIKTIRKQIMTLKHVSKSKNQEKNKKKSMTVFKNSGQSLIKFNQIESNSKQLTALATRY